MDFVLIDAFATAPFTGNPAAVVRGSPGDDALKQRIAMEFNQAETAFVERLGDDRFALRWFTPRAEVSLCGHATLAAARALWDWRDATSNRITFVTRFSGELICERDDDGSITLDFPATAPVAAPLPPDAATVLGIDSSVVCVGVTPMNLTLALASQADVERASPDLRALATWHPVGVTITARSADGDTDFVSRFFAPAVGIDEDPVTGSAHCTLAVHWSRELGKTRFRAGQLSRRGGVLGVELHASRVRLLGASVIVARGTLDLGG